MVGIGCLRRDLRVIDYFFVDVGRFVEYLEGILGLNRFDQYSFIIINEILNILEMFNVRKTLGLS